MKKQEIMVGFNYVKMGKDYSNTANRRFVGMTGSTLHGVSNIMNTKKVDDSDYESDQNNSNNTFNFVFSKNNPITLEYKEKNKSIHIYDQKNYISLKKTLYSQEDFYFYMTSSSPHFHLEFEHIKK